MSAPIDFVVWSQNRDVIGCYTLPDPVTPETGFLLVVHGLGNHRFQYAAMMADFSARFNLICVSPEYRDSGRDSGRGKIGGRDPYDFSHLQVADALNCLRRVKLDFPRCDPSRTFAWGGSQGGHIVLLAAEFAPNTFALAINACGITDMAVPLSPDIQVDFRGAQAEIRSPARWVERIRNKVVTLHGTADDLVPVEHARALERELIRHGIEHEVHYTDGGDHFLGPRTSREAETLRWCSADLQSRRITGPDDFERGTVSRFTCTGAEWLASFEGGWFALNPVTSQPDQPPPSP